jgi:phage-related baseplate assembly protein
MPSKFGAPAKTSITQKQNKIEIGVLSYDANGDISNTVTSLLMENIAAYLSKFRMINDYVVVKPAEIVDLGFEIGVLVENGQQISAVSNITTIVSNEFLDAKKQLGKSYSVGEMIKKMTQVDGVLNINYVKAFNKTGVGYSTNTTSQSLIDSVTGEMDITNNYIIVDEYQMLNIRNSDVDIKVIPVIATGIN